MDATLADFLNEINEIAPPKQTKPKEKDNGKQVLWQECYDELTGYSYYWNTKTDEVTWTTPAEFKPVKQDQKKTKKSSLLKKEDSRSELFVPPRAAPFYPSTSSKLNEDSVKIYSIGKNTTNIVTEKSQFKEVKSRKRLYKPNSDSEDEKIVLISSYGGDSDSDSNDHEPNDKQSKNVSNTSNIRQEQPEDKLSDEEDDLDILTKIQKRAQELKEIGGELPPEVSTIVNRPVTEIKSQPTIVSTKEKKKSIAGFSLVAGYSDSEEEQENGEMKSLFPVKPTINEAPKVSHSTLFPITQPINVKDFLQPKPEEIKPASPTQNFDSKAFQRKRRIGVALVNTSKKKEDNITPDDPENERKGFGFGKDTESKVTENIYPAFKKGGVMFIKSDVLNPSFPQSGSVTSKEEMDFELGEKKVEGTINVKREEVDDLYATLKEKLGFLCEGRPSVSPVQVMVIQAETLFEATKDGSLKLTYIHKWLNDTCSELIQLEKEAAPEGWLLQWDRSNKRYYYQNQATGVSQWEYPQPDISRCDEAMDISTTPPPTEPTIHLSPPLPPSIRSPSPPPPPIISVDLEPEANDTVPDVPLPPEPAPPLKFVENGEPLPPGVDLPEIVTYSKPKEEGNPADSLNFALDSFYSDIAAIENTDSCSSPPPLPLESGALSDNQGNADLPADSAKKKRKKVKLAPGLSMKKKGVSKLVEKWKNVQQHYND